MTGREKRFLLYLLVLLAGFGFYWWRARWSPTVRLETSHFLILATATTNQTREIGEVSEKLYLAYRQTLTGRVPLRAEHPLLKMKLYRDREEFRRCARVWGYAEAFYRQPWCHAYYDDYGANSSHWMLHEVVHQLNAEVAQLDLARWLDEGLADYFGSSRFVRGQLLAGTVDLNTYPVWWIETLATAGSLETDLRNGSIIPLRALVSGRGGPSVNKKVNLYYLHWWALVHFLLHYEDGKYRDRTFDLLREGGSLAAFEQQIGPIERVQAEWYGYIRALKRKLEGLDLEGLSKLQHLGGTP